MLVIQASGDSSKKYFPLAKMVYSISEWADVTVLFIKLKCPFWIILYSENTF